MKQILLLVCFLVISASGLFGIDLRDVIAQPEKFENQRITVIGIARVSGYFYLCADEKAANDRHPDKAFCLFERITAHNRNTEKWIECGYR